MEVADPDAEDRAALEQIDAMMVEFHCDGRLVTTTFKADGTAVTNTSETYSTENDVITINDPEYELTALYRFEDGHLRIHSRQFVIVMEPIRQTAEHGIGHHR